MSQWTHVRGGLELVSSPYEQKKFTLERPSRDNEEAWDKWRTAFLKTFYLPFPEEQFKLTMPKLRNRYRKPTKKDSRDNYYCLDFEAYIYSLPRAKKYIDEAFKLLPQGEVGFRYSIKQDAYDYSSSCSCFDVPCLRKYYKDALNRMYKAESTWDSYTFEELVKYMHVDKECGYRDVNSMVLGIREDLRGCSGEELQKGLEKFLKYLKEHDIDVEDGYLEWQDEWEPKNIYAWRCSRVDWDYVYEFTIFDKKTNKLSYRKRYVYKKDEKGHDLYDDELEVIEEHFNEPQVNNEAKGE